MKVIGCLTLAAVCLGGLHTHGKDTPSPSYTEVLSAAPAAELPAAAAAVIKSAKVREREATTTQVVKAGVALNPAAAAPLAGAIAKAVPDMAAAAAGAAAAEQPKQACAIARAAAAGAPAKAGKIVAAVCRVVPDQYRSVAVAVAEVAPTAGKDIVKSVGTAVPELKPYIESSMASYGLGVLPVGATLDQAGRGWVQAGGGSLTPVSSTAPVAAAAAVSTQPSTPVAVSGAPMESAASAAPAAPPGGSTPPVLVRPPAIGSSAPSTGGNSVAPSRNYSRP